MAETNTLRTPAGLLRDPRRIAQQLDTRAGPGGFANQGDAIWLERFHTVSGLDLSNTLQHACRELSRWRGDMDKVATARERTWDEVQDAYNRGMLSAALINHKKYSKPYLATLRATWTRFLVYAKKQLKPQPDKTLKTVDPFDVLIHIQEYAQTTGTLGKGEALTVSAVDPWTGQERTVRIEGPFCAPGTLLPEISRLKTCFEQLVQRRGEWSIGNQLGNPVDNPLVRDWYEGYARMVRAAGYDEEAAVPLSFYKYKRHMEFLDAKILSVGRQTPRGLTLQALALADCLQWETHRRPWEIGKLERRGLYGSSVERPSAGYVASFLQCSDEPGTVYYLDPRETKTRKTALRKLKPEQAIVLKVKEVDQAALCPIARLKGYLRDCDAGGRPPVDYLLRPSRTSPESPDATSGPVENKPLDPDYINKRFKAHLQEAGLYDGESAYSLKRGGIQYRKARGHTDASIMADADIQDARVFARYSAPEGHLGRRVTDANGNVQRQRRRTR